MGQSKRASLLEALVNVTVGFLVSLIVWTFVVVPIWNLPVSMHENLQITLLFTAVSVARSYVWRRVFNSFTHRETYAPNRP